MRDSNIANRYAKPLLELAHEKGALEAVHEDMTTLRTTCQENREFLAVLQSPVIHNYKKLAILKKVFKGRLNPLTDSLFEILTRRNREGILYTLAIEFNHLYNHFKGIEEIKLISAVALTDALKNEIKVILATKLNKTILLEEKIDPSLIGGFVVQLGNSKIDNSIKNSLHKLKQNFIQKLYN
jgi:F-type H+-transporting ATPase subunit delta